MCNLADPISMTEVPNAATLEVSESELERLERRIAELEADGERPVDV
jgi:polyhydroxyalkanoate synthesis regulator phasin